MDEHSSMEGPPRITVDGWGPIPVPQTYEDWMLPYTYVGQHINWYMTRSFLLEQHVPKWIINEYYKIPNHQEKFAQILLSSRGREHTNLVSNASQYITDFELQPWLLTTMAKLSPEYAEFIIDDFYGNSSTDFQKLKEYRMTVWQLIK